MTREEAIKIIQNEYKCVDRDCDIDRNCGKCDLMMLTKEPILKAYDMAIKALSQEPICDRDCEHCTWTECPIEPCDEKRDCSTCKYEHNDGHTQPCRDCGTLLESYTNWEQKERELPCIYDLKNRYCPRLNESGFLIYPQQEVKQEPCDDAISRDALITKLVGLIKTERSTIEIKAKLIPMIEQLPSVTQKSGKWIKHPEIETSAPKYLMFYECSECGDKQCFCKPDIHKKRFCSNCGARMIEPQERSE